MSTRSVTELHDSDRSHRTYSGHRQVALYRHCDGYPAEAGAALVEALRGAKSTTEALARLLRLTYDATSYSPARRIYELTSKIDDHGDLDHAYTAWLSRDGWHVGHQRRTLYEDPVRAWTKATYTLAEFVEIVNADRRGINGRIAELRKQYPSHESSDDYPMVPPIEEPAHASA